MVLAAALLPLAGPFPLGPHVVGQRWPFPVWRPSWLAQSLAAPPSLAAATLAIVAGAARASTAPVRFVVLLGIRHADDVFASALKRAHGLAVARSRDRVRAS